MENSLSNIQIGYRVFCNWMGSGFWYSGEISQIDLDDNLFNVLYDDGDIENNVPRSRLKKDDTKFYVGQQIKGNWQNQGIYYNGRIIKINQVDKTFDILYEDGDEETDVPRRNIKLVNFSVGDNILANYLGKGGWFPGIIKGINGCLYEVMFKDGDHEINILPINITKNLLFLQTNSPVIANWKGKGAYLPGKIMKAESEKKYKIRYTDGEIESGVPRKWIRNEIYLSLQKDQKVLCNFKNSGTYFPGKVLQIHTIPGDDPSEKVYDIRFDDGDNENKVTIDKIVPLEETTYILQIDQHVAGEFKFILKFYFLTIFKLFK